MTVPKHGRLASRPYRGKNESQVVDGHIGPPLQKNESRPNHAPLPNPYFRIDKNFSTTPSGSLQKKILEPWMGPLGTVAGSGEHMVVPSAWSFS